MTTSADALPRRPDLRFVLSHPAHLLAFGFGVGLSRVAPGTMGTLAVLPVYWWAASRVPDFWFLAGLPVLFLLGIWACERTGRDLGVHDHGGMVFDEMVAFLLVLYLIPVAPVWQAFGFLLFRLFDILKPLHVGWMDRRFKGGFGVMLDDIGAAFYALLVLAAWRALTE